MQFEHIVCNARQHTHSMATSDREKLAEGQQPLALFVTCSDSRIVPAQITGAEPGKLFELRTAGNIVPEYAPASASSEMATIEYAVLQLRVPEIIVCAHSHCAAVKALTVAGRGLEHLPALQAWLGTDKGHRTNSGEVLSDPAVRAEAKQHVRDQVHVLGRYPFIRDRVEFGELCLHGWFYEIDTGAVLTLDPATGEFLPL